MVLSNGTMIHKACLEEKEQRLNEIEKNIEQTKRDIAKNTRILDKSRSLIYRFFISFTGSYSSPKIMEQRIIMLKENLKALYEEQKVIQRQLKRVYDFLLYYPPDWDERRALVRERDHCCKKCGKCSFMLDQFHVHHKIPLSQGGSNKIENLILLCDKCHKRIHGVDSFSYLPSEERKACPEKILKIQQALQEGRKVEFLYKKPSDTIYIRRIVNPYELLQIKHRDEIGSTLCVRGFCYLRNAERTFALKRIRDLKIR
jgi:hypothetical protein